jgi:hypothetical protein
MKKDCFNCAHIKRQTKGGEFIGYSCCGDPAGGRKWSLTTAEKVGRCGPKRIWFAKQDGQAVRP